MTAWLNINHAFLLHKFMFKFGKLKITYFWNPILNHDGKVKVTSRSNRTFT
jgi:hypothetical protein